MVNTQGQCLVTVTYIPSCLLWLLSGGFLGGLSLKTICGTVSFKALLLAHLWCAYAMALCLSWIVRREVGCVCVEHNYPKMWMD